MLKLPHPTEMEKLFPSTVENFYESQHAVNSLWQCRKDKQSRTL